MHSVDRPRGNDTAASRWRFDAIGVPWEIETPTPLAEPLRTAVLDRIDAYDRAWSRFRTDSLVARIAREPGAWRLPDDARDLFELYRLLYTVTRGRMSPLVARSLARLGYGPELTAGPNGGPISAPRWEDAIAWDGTLLSAPRPVTLDVGAAGKGQLVDRVVDVLTAGGVRDVIVDASGDIRRCGTGAIRVGLEHPGDPARVIGVGTLGTGALCASAINRRTWGDGMHHVLDALTGLPTDRVVATWVVAETALVADGLATALFFAEPEEISAHFDFQFARIAGGRVESSSDFPGVVFS